MPGKIPVENQDKFLKKFLGESRNEFLDEAYIKAEGVPEGTPGQILERTLVGIPRRYSSIILQ